MDRKPFLKQVNIVDVPAVDVDGIVYTATKKIQIVQEDTESFFFLYNYLNAFINNCTSIADIKVLNWITLNLEYNKSCIRLLKREKNEIKEYTGLSMSAIERSIGVLTKEGILIKDPNYVRGAIYYVNSTYVWKGDRGKRKDNLKFILEVVQSENLSQREKEIEEDVKRYEKIYKEEMALKKELKNTLYSLKY